MSILEIYLYLDHLVWNRHTYLVRFSKLSPLNKLHRSFAFNYLFTFYQYSVIYRYYSRSKCSLVWNTPITQHGNMNNLSLMELIVLQLDESSDLDFCHTPVQFRENQKSSVSMLGYVECIYTLNYACLANTNWCSSLVQ